MVQGNGDSEGQVNLTGIKAWAAGTGGLRVPVPALLALALAGVALAVSGFVALGAAIGVAGLVLAVVAGVLFGLALTQSARDRAEQARIFHLVGDDAAACFSTDAEGHVLLRNRAAELRFGTDSASMLEALQRNILNPSALLLKLQARAAAEGAAREDVLRHHGVMRLTVHRSGQDRFLWRVEEFGAATGLDAPDRPGERSGDRGVDRPPAPQGVRVPDKSPIRAGAEAGGADLEEVPVALMTFGPDGVLRSANRAARALLLQGELRSLMFHDLFEGLGRPVTDWLGDVVAGRLPGGTEVLRARSGGEESFVEVTLRRFDEGGRTSALAVLNDATRLKTLEAQFIQSQKMQAIGQLAGGIAHDFNNLLTAISGHCDLLLLRHGRDAPDFADLEQIRQNANRAASLVGQLLAFSRKQTLKPERLDLEEVLADLTHLMNRLVVERVGLKLEHLGQGSNRALRPVRADRRQLEQVLINLVVNARDAMPDKGSIVIETEPVTLVENLHRDRAIVPAGDYSVIRVIDHGVGIAPENLQKIFEPFFTTKRVGEGTGLGLSMAYGIVKQSGGFIFADSVLGKGTTFSLYFPAYDGEDLAAPEPEVRRSTGKPGEGVVLLVEDEAAVRAFASRALRLRGYTVLEAATAEEALETLQDRSLEVDVFVTDVVMPGMDGPAWVRIALETRPNVKVIFVSGYAEDALSENQARIPNSVFLPKPFSLNDLTAAVQAQFH
jgi:two-component system, cell cycle sensor histidine kinase and response regulator CckA